MKATNLIEVFKTNITRADHAAEIVDCIHCDFGFRANFDLDDCDRVLRVHSEVSPIDSSDFIRYLASLDCMATVLPDVPYATPSMRWLAPGLATHLPSRAGDRPVEETAPSTLG